MLLMGFNNECYSSTSDEICQDQNVEIAEKPDQFRSIFVRFMCNRLNEQHSLHSMTTSFSRPQFLRRHAQHLREALHRPLLRAALAFEHHGDGGLADADLLRQLLL